MKSAALKILKILASIWAISVVAFFISVSAPGDPISNNPRFGGERLMRNQNTSELKRLRQELHLDLPLFYFHVQPSGIPDTIAKIPDRLERESVRFWAVEIGHAEELQHLRNETRSLLQKEPSPPLLYLLQSNSRNQANANISILENSTNSELVQLSFKWREYLARHPESGRKIPRFSWNGRQNQYHQWFVGFLGGNLGYSYTDGLPISDKIGQKLSVSLGVIIIAIILSYLIAIPVGLYAGAHPDSRFDRWVYRTTMTWYAMPSFFVGTLLLLVFSNPEMLNIFPTGGIYDPFAYEEDWPWYSKVGHRIPYMVLPVFTYAYGLTAVLIRLFRRTVIEEYQKHYTTSVRAKGLSELRVRFVHIFKNASFPLITVLGRLLPAAIGGSVIVETIFSIPGMGLGLYDAMMARDYPFIVAVFTITGALTIFGYGLSDLLYTAVDPRLKRKKP